MTTDGHATPAWLGPRLPCLFVFWCSWQSSREELVSNTMLSIFVLDRYLLLNKSVRRRR